MAASEPTIEDLFARFRTSHDRVALADFYVRTRPIVERVAHRWAGGHAQAEDAVQNTFLRAIESAETYDLGRPILPWLTAILQNELRCAHRRRHRATRAEREPLRATVDDVEPIGERIAMFNEWALRLRTSIQKLPIRQQEVLVLHLCQGLGPSEIAQRLGRSEATIRTQLHRGRARLLAMLPSALAIILLAPRLDAARPRPAQQTAGHLRLFGIAALPAALVVALAVGLLTQATDTASRPVPVTAAPPPTIAPSEHAAPELVRQPAVLAATTSSAAGQACWQVRVEDDAGNTMRGLRLRARPKTGPDPLLHERWLVTDELGIARSDAFGDAAEQVLVEVDRGGGGLVSAATSELPQRLVVPPGYTIRGRVVDNGQGIAGACIWMSAADSDTDGQEVAVSAADGTFEIAPISGRRHLRARSGCRASGPPIEIAGQPGDVLRLDLELTVPVANLIGRVMTGNVPVAHALVSVGDLPFGAFGNERAPVQCWSDDQGWFRAEAVPTGKIPIRVLASTLAPLHRKVVLTPGSTTTYDVFLERGASIAGRVLDGLGRPVKNAWIGSLCEGRGQLLGAFTNDDGDYVVQGLPANVTLWVAVGSTGVLCESWNGLPPGSRTQWHPIIGKSLLPIAGVLVDTAGSPLAGWTVIAISHLARSDQPGRRLTTATESSGRFAFSSCSEGLWAIGLRAPNAAFTMPELPNLTAGDTDAVLRVDPCAASIRLSGSILGRDGVPLTRGTATLWRADRLERLPLVLDEFAHFAAVDLPPGRYGISITAPDHTPLIRNDLILANPFEDLGSIELEGLVAR